MGSGVSCRPCACHVCITLAASRRWRAEPRRCYPIRRDQSELPSGFIVPLEGHISSSLQRLSRLRWVINETHFQDKKLENPAHPMIGKIKSGPCAVGC